MALDRFTAAVGRRMAAAYPDLGGTVTDAAEARRLHKQSRFPAGPPVAEVKDVSVPGTGPGLRVYRPEQSGDHALPVVVYSHGGGFVLCDLETHDGICRMLAVSTPAVVVAVDYRRAPEDPFPAAVDDVYRAVCWAHEHAAGWGADPARLTVAGDSAGGNLATVAGLCARDHGGPPIHHQLLIYPVTDCLAERADPPDSLLTAAHMRWFLDQYLAGPADAHHPHASPLHAPDLADLPPATVLTVEHDPLLPEGAAYAAALARAGVPVDYRCFPGVFHGTFGYGSVLPAIRPAEQWACAAIRQPPQATP